MWRTSLLTSNKQWVKNSSCLKCYRAFFVHSPVSRKRLFFFCPLNEDAVLYLEDLSLSLVLGDCILLMGRMVNSGTKEYIFLGTLLDYFGRRFPVPLIGEIGASTIWLFYPSFLVKAHIYSVIECVLLYNKYPVCRWIKYWICLIFFIVVCSSRDKKNCAQLRITP